MFKEHQLVTLINNRLVPNIPIGSVGVIVHVYPLDIEVQRYEVEFNIDGKVEVVGLAEFYLKEKK